MARFSSISLTKGQTTIVDEGDYDAVAAVGRWCYSNSGYAVHYYADEYGQRKTLYLHRFIVQRMSREGIPPGMQVDHRNQNRIDNRRLNLRLATRSQNQANKGVPVNNTSQYKGVTFNTGRWEARIRYQGKRLYLGRFTNPLDAAMIYDAASRLLYQDFAGCNIQDQPTSSHVEKQLREMLDKSGLETRHLVLK
jgi:hypothetical protein